MPDVYPLDSATQRLNNRGQCSNCFATLPPIELRSVWRMCMDIWGLKGLRLGNNFFNCLFLLLYNDSQICCLEVTEVMGVSLHHITGEKITQAFPNYSKKE